MAAKIRHKIIIKELILISLSVRKLLGVYLLVVLPVISIIHLLSLAISLLLKGRTLTATLTDDIVIYLV